MSKTSSPKTLESPKSITLSGLLLSLVKNKKFSGFKSLEKLLREILTTGIPMTDFITMAIINSLYYLFKYCLGLYFRKITIFYNSIK